MDAGVDSRTRTEATFFGVTATLISRLVPLLNRPLLLGAAAVLASLFCSSTLARALPFPEVNSAPALVHAATSPRTHDAQAEQVPPLLLLILGLASLALSQTRGTEKPKPKEGDSCAGKKVPPRQKLPKIRKPQPVLAPLEPSSLGVIAREHHDDVMGFEPVGGFRMLHK